MYPFAQLFRVPSVGLAAAFCSSALFAAGPENTTGVSTWIRRFRRSPTIFQPSRVRVIFTTLRGGGFSLYERSAGGSGAETAVPVPGLDVGKFASHWSPDGRFLAFVAGARILARSDVWMLPLNGGGKPFAFLETPALETHPRFPRRTNVQLAHPESRDSLSALVWERGAGETRASGSSAVAVGAAAVARGWCTSPVRVVMPGGELVVEVAESFVVLTGPAEQICAGKTHL